MRDNIYQNPVANVAGFRFDDKVAAVFPDMISRSVPGYSNIIAMTGLLAERYGQAGSRCYDLGCSLGASTLSMIQHTQGRALEFIGVDNSSAMISRCREALAQAAPEAQVELIEDDIQNVAIENASMAVLNFTLQFVPLADRDRLIERIYHGLNAGGALILSEKIRFDSPMLQELNTDIHHAFKRANGYSELEVSQKRQAIENVLIPETLDDHYQRLARAGFTTYGLWFQCFSFMSLVAIK